MPPDLQKLNSVAQNFAQNPSALLSGLHLPDSGPLHGIYLFIKFTFIVLDLALAFGFGWALVGLVSMRPKFDTPIGKEEKKTLTLRVEFFRERWADILKRANEGSPDSVRIAIIEADALVDTALKDAGIEGEHMADRLSTLDFEDVKSLENLWNAHRLRNDLVHTPGFAVTQEEAVSTLKSYEAFLNEIEAL